MDDDSYDDDGYDVDDSDDVDDSATDDDPDEEDELLEDDPDSDDGEADDVGEDSPDPGEPLDDVRFGSTAGINEDTGNTVSWSNSFNGYYDDKTWQEVTPK